MEFRVEVRLPRRVDLGRIERAIAEGLNEGGDKVRTQVQRALKTQTGVVKYSSITSRMRTMRAFPGAALSGVGPSRPAGLQYVIIATGKGIPIEEFRTRLTARGVVSNPWGVRHLFKRSFWKDGKGKTGFRARLTDKKFPIRALFGPSLPKELGQGRALAAFVTTSSSAVPAAVLKRLARALR